MTEQGTSASLSTWLESFDQGIHDATWEGFPVRVVRQAFGDLVFSLFGAQVLWFKPEGQPPVLWTTQKPQPKPKAVRGGVPLCWPWFAEPLENKEGQPFHGVARTVEWEVDQQTCDDQGGEWLLKPVGPLWPDLDLALVIKVHNGALTLTMKTHNISDTTVRMTQALHTYLAISSRSNVRVEGLDGARYSDKNEDFAEFTQSGALPLTQAIDRIYQADSLVKLIDTGWNRVLLVDKQFSGSTVVWNAGDAAADVLDIGLDQVDDYLCIEAANTRQYDLIELSPDQRTQLSTTLSSQPL
jgi:glucose-6-phosphate 1-epimerase